MHKERKKKEILSSLRLERTLVLAYDTIPTGPKFDLFPDTLEKTNLFELEVRIKFFQIFSAASRLVNEGVNPSKIFATIRKLLREDRIILPIGFDFDDIDDFWTIVSKVNPHDRSKSTESI